MTYICIIQNSKTKTNKDIMKKLLAEYHERITQYDNEIVQLTQLIRGIRKGKKHFLTVEELSNDRKIIDAKRIQLVQVVKDLEDYL